ncbi:hypothetical protein ACHAXT_007162 [Thalassiosira profunda]
MSARQLLLLAAALAAPLGASAFAALPAATSPSVLPLHASAGGQGEATDGASSGVVSVDVSDLGITMADLEKKIPIHNFSFESSGYQSTSRIPDVNDNGCHWVENPEDIDVTLRIPGLIGQPAEALSVLFSTTTVSVAAFGRIVWSAIQMGISDTDDCMFLTEEGKDGVPVIQLCVKKRDLDERWGGFILQVGEDSLL